MSLDLEQPDSSAAARRIEELGRIILAYSEVTDKLQQSHELLNRTVEHLRRELNEKNRLLERKSRLAALGEMAAGMAHEIRNPLGGIQLYASLLANDVADRPASAEIVTKISKGVKRLESIVSQVLQFSRDTVINPQPCDLIEIVEQSVELATNSRSMEAVEFRMTGPATLPVDIDPLLMGQSILNLVLNAIDAMDGGGVVRINTEAPDESGDVKQFRLTVRDAGPGIPSEVIDRIFNPFFTTKDSGTGLGLSIVHRIIEAHDGTILATNGEDGCGAKFEIRI